MKFEDVMLDRNMLSTSPRQRTPGPRDVIIDIDDNAANDSYSVSPRSPSAIDHRRRTLANAAEDDVCFPVEGMSEIGEEEFADRRPDGVPQPRRRRARHWPDLSELEEWARQEKAERDNIENVRAKKISEPVLVQGRLRPQKTQWHREEDDAPYRYTYFNEEFDATIHSRTLSELCQLGATFRELFIPEPPELADETSDEEDDESADHPTPMNGQSKAGTRQSSVMGDRKSGENTGENTPQPPQLEKSKGKRYGPRPTWWLDILSPTEAEMRVICRTFGIHPLTQEDILMQEAREKVELFRNYYFVNYRTFEQDKDSEDYLEPVNMYVVVFREGVLSFHFSMTPHPANVRRRIRQLSDYLILSSDWISY
ncbi:CorA metal ion transporter, partial [Cryomyces antarcticus]